MINLIIDAIRLALNAAFGDGYEIFTESVEQGINQPCFSVNCLNLSNSLFLNKRYCRENAFCIRFYPGTTQKNAECNTVADALFDCLNYIHVGGDLVRGTKMRGELSNGILNFYVNYDMFTCKVEEAVKMENLQQADTEAKG